MSIRRPIRLIDVRRLLPLICLFSLAIPCHGQPGGFSPDSLSSAQAQVLVGRALSINDKPLSQEDEQKEQARLDALASNPSLQRHRKQNEDEDFGIVLKLLRMLPNAFLYQYAGTGTGPSGSLQKFTFRPNPKFSPPDYETQALTALRGELWIDASQERVVRLGGHLQQDTDYGGGIPGRLNKGGWVVIEQADVGGRQW